MSARENAKTVFAPFSSRFPWSFYAVGVLGILLAFERRFLASYVLFQDKMGFIHSRCIGGPGGTRSGCGTSLEPVRAVKDEYTKEELENTKPMEERFGTLLLPPLQDFKVLAIVTDR